MTKEEFNKKYPDGLNTELVTISKALHMIMTTKEIDRCINQAEGAEKKWLKDFKKNYKKLATDWDVPIWSVLMNIQSSLLFCDILGVMVSMEKSVYHGELEEQ